MVETLAPAGYAGRLRTTPSPARRSRPARWPAASSRSAGSPRSAPRSVPARPRVAALVALAAAAGEARGARIVPQVRRQVPESWRRVLPRPARRRALRRPARARLHDVHPELRRVGARGDQPGARRPGARAGDRARLRRRARAARGRPGAGAAAGALHAAMAERPRILRGAAGARRGRARRLRRRARRRARRAPRSTPPAFADPSADGAALALHRPGRRRASVRPRGARDLAARHATPRSAAAAGLDRRRRRGGRRRGHRSPRPARTPSAVDAGWVGLARRAATLWAASLTDGAVPRPVVRRRPRAARARRQPARSYDFATGTRIDAIDLANGVRHDAAPRAATPSCAASRRWATGSPTCYATYRRQQLRIGRLAVGAHERATASSTAPCRPAAATPATSPAHRHAHGPHAPTLWAAPAAGRRGHADHHRARDADCVYVTRLRQRRRATRVRPSMLRFAR